MATGQKDANGNDFTIDTLRQAIFDDGMTIESHYKQYGRNEGLQPNEYFNENEYLLSKLNQLNSTEGKTWTLAELKETIANAGMIPAEHYEKYGCIEKDGNGNYLNPSNDFDTTTYTYYTQKLALLQAEDPSWAGKSIDDVAAAIHNADMSPVSHYKDYGKAEAEASGIELVGEVPEDRKVDTGAIDDGGDDGGDDDDDTTGNAVYADASAGTPTNAAELASLSADIEKVYVTGSSSAISNDVTLAWSPFGEGKYKAIIGDENTSSTQYVSKIDFSNVHRAKIKTVANDTSVTHVIDSFETHNVSRVEVDTSGASVIVNGEIGGDGVYKANLYA